MRAATCIVLSLVALLASCVARPDPADVAAERDRWTFLRDLTIDGQVDPQEAPVLAAVLVQWDAQLQADEEAAGAPRDARTILVDLVRAYGLAAVQLFLVPELQAKAPELFRLLDKDTDGILSEAELLAVDPTDPVFAVVLITTVHRLLTKR